MLKIIRLLEDHNHDLNEILFNHLQNQESKIIKIKNLKVKINVFKP